MGLLLSWTLFVAAAALHAGVAFEAPPLLLGVALTTVAWNGLRGAGTAVAGCGLVALSGGLQGWGVLAYLVAFSLVCAALTDRLVGEMRLANADARRGLGLLSVLLAGLRRVARAEGADGVASTLPGVLDGVDGDGFAVWRISGDAPEPVAGGMDAIAESETVDAVRSVAAEGRAVTRRLGRSSGRQHLEAYPVLERGDVAAVVTSMLPRALSPAERAVVEEFAGTLGHLIKHVYEERTGGLVLDLVEHHGDASGTAGMSRALLDLAVPEMKVWGGVIMRYRAGRFVAESVTGTLPPGLRDRLVEGFPYGQGVIWQVHRDGQPLFIEDYARAGSAASEVALLGVASVAMVPVGGRGCSHVVVLVHDARRVWAARERTMLATLAQVLGASIRQREVEERLEETARLQRELLSIPPERMYSRLLDTAVRLVPGAEAASLLVRGDDGAFGFVATVGYDLEALSQVRWAAEDMATWYAEDMHGWSRGEPRVFVSGERRSVAQISALSVPSAALGQASRVDEIVANLCLPVVYGGEVLAVLNFDALRDPNAFGARSREAAAGLAPLVGFLLHESDLRAKLEKAARSDALTGLGNRRAFNEQAARDVARSVRHGEELALLVVDLKGFKALNDALGHDEGDRALVAAADALQRTVRQGDSVYRWGGDEFAALLPHADAASAAAVAERIAEEIGRLPAPAHALSANIGIACVPADGADMSALLRVADERMYAAKTRGLAVLGSPRPGPGAEGR